MKNRDKIEFYNGRKIIAAVSSSIFPPVDSKISIRGKTWIVTRVTFALDHADEIAERGMRANVDIVPDNK